MNKKSVFVILTENYPRKSREYWKKFDLVVAPTKLQQKIEDLGCAWVPLEKFVEPGSIYEARDFAVELSRLTFPDGSRLVKSCVYQGYELWWTNYQTLYTHFCLPFTQYKKLLEYVKNFQSVTFDKSQFTSLFSCYLRAHGCEVSIFKEFSFKSPSFLPFGMLLQIIITLLFVPVLVLRKQNILVFTGDKFEKNHDYDFRLKFIYEELRVKGISFVEFVRSLSPWDILLGHALVRRRPVIYSEAITFIGRFISFITGGKHRARLKFGDHNFVFEKTPDRLFKYYVASQYLLTVYDDIWAIQIMKWILPAIGIKAAFIPAANERNFHTVLGCKLNGIPVVGIQHGAQSHHYNVYDFMQGFDGGKSLSVEAYGVWSEWWKEYYIKNSKTYKPEQLFVSGPMRPIQKPILTTNDINFKYNKNIKVLFVSEVVADPTEVIVYLDALCAAENVSLYVKFRSSHDNFEDWLENNRPDILNKLKDRLLKGGMFEAIELCDVIVGSQSTGVIEATLQEKPFVFFNTKKWGDYFDMDSISDKYNFFAKNPEELIKYVAQSKTIPVEILKELKQKFFGDPYKNGSKWVVDQLVKSLDKE